MQAFLKTIVPELNILLVEDSENDSLLLLRELRRGGYQVKSQRLDSLEELEEALCSAEWDMIICDYALPDFSGLDVLQILTQKNIDLPFLIVSGTINEEMAVSAMKAGAHDYLMKGNLTRLVPAVERELREAAIRKERKKAEEQLREQAALLDVAQDAILVLTLEDQITYWNKSAERLYGWSAAQAQGWKARELLFPSIPPIYTTALQIVKENGEWEGDWTQITKYKKAVIVESRWKLLRDASGQPKSILTVNTDITEKKQLEAQFLRSQRLESIGTLAGGIAHDLNNVLAPILMATEILKIKYPDPANDKLLNILEASAKRGSNIVRQVLTFARGTESNQGELQLKHLIRDITQMAKETFPKLIEIVAHTPKDLWIISGDATQLQQVLLNLCVNARDAMPNGGRLTVKADNIYIDDNNILYRNHQLKPGTYILLNVSDTGQGIPPEILERIFEPFFSTKPVGQGTGLGLSTVMGIIKSHNGFINVDTEVGRGTTFNIYLPAKADSSSDLPETKIDQLPQGKGELILVVDDEAPIRLIAKHSLEAHGYEVLTAEDGSEAIAVYVQNQQQIKAILMDMKMPVMDGPATLRALLKINPDVKVIITSGMLAGSETETCKTLQAKAVIQKPYKTIQLLKTLARVLNSGNSSA